MSLKIMGQRLLGLQICFADNKECENDSSAEQVIEFHNFAETASALFCIQYFPSFAFRMVRYFCIFL